MICPTCNEWDIGEPPWPSWYQCANCDIHPEISLHMKAQRERIAALETENAELRRMLADAPDHSDMDAAAFIANQQAGEIAALEAKLEACLQAKSKLYPPGAKYLNNPDNINDPRMIDEHGEIVTP